MQPTPEVGDAQARASSVPFAASLARFRRSPTFARDIALVLALKILLLAALKFAFFNHPRAADMSMPPAEVARALLSSTASRVPQGVGHAQ
ncbi:cytochrome oxidase putative small subunit CydP [Trinickia diaoshuihuensis]|jgi:hypothetical protein|uniref:cytochrome oxidase putative small subunit CydP n=1 Tax=Trinickia diaoshuihuensis TaxID=2292265 RepID=UPI000E268D7A|nr:cytochrome oxidase putative small subunit CydP [Trinickia diaoshuihuensis]